MEEFVRKHRYILLFILSTPFYIVWLINSPTIRSSIDVKREVMTHYDDLDKQNQEFIEEYNKKRKERREYEERMNIAVKNLPRLEKELAELDAEIQKAIEKETGRQNKSNYLEWIIAISDRKLMEINDIKFYMLANNANLNSKSYPSGSRPVTWEK